MKKLIVGLLLSVFAMAGVQAESVAGDGPKTPRRRAHTYEKKIQPVDKKKFGRVNKKGNRLYKNKTVKRVKRSGRKPSGAYYG